MPATEEKVKLLDRARQLLAARHVAAQTQSAYTGWIHRFILFHHKRHPSELGKTEAATFLSDLATTHRLAARERNQALAALVFLYRDVLPGDYPWVSQLRVSTPQGQRNENQSADSSESELPKQDGATMSPPVATIATEKPKLLDQVRHAIRVRHMARSTEKTYVDWIRKFILFHNKRHPLEMGKEEVSAFLTHLAIVGNVSASTQNQALAALLFLYREVLEKDFGWLDDVVRAKKPKRLPVVFTPQEVEHILQHLSGRRWLMAMILYGGGLRAMECLRLRIKELDFDRLQITVRDAKGAKDRVTLLPKAVVAPLQQHLKIVQQEHERALREGYAGVELPFALARKYPNADKEWGWQYVFPADKPSRDPRSGAFRRHHLYDSYLQDGLKSALKKAGIIKPAGCHTFRHSFATHLIAAGVDIDRVRQLMGHKDVRTTQIYLHVAESSGLDIPSPADRLFCGNESQR